MTTQTTTGRRRPSAEVRAATSIGVRARLRLWIGLRLLSGGAAVPAEARRRARRLPSVRALAEASGVHRNTAAAVYRDLERFGLVRCIRGTGTFAGRPPDLGAGGLGPACRDAGLARVLAAELGTDVLVERGRAEPHGAAPGSRRPLLVPLDEVPPPRRRVVPVAPNVPALTAMGRLPPGAVVELLSTSLRLGRLVRATLEALHGGTVGLDRVTVRRGSESGPGPDLRLVDALQLQRLVAPGGTPAPPGVFTPLRLTGHCALDSGPRAG